MSFPKADAGGGGWCHELLKARLFFELGITFEQVQKTWRKKEESVDTNRSKVDLVFIEGRGGEKLAKVLTLQPLWSRMGRNREYKLHAASHF